MIKLDRRLLQLLDLLRLQGEGVHRWSMNSNAGRRNTLADRQPRHSTVSTVFSSRTVFRHPDRTQSPQPQEGPLLAIAFSLPIVRPQARMDAGKGEWIVSVFHSW